MDLREDEGTELGDALPDADISGDADRSHDGRRTRIRRRMVEAKDRPRWRRVSALGSD